MVPDLSESPALCGLSLVPLGFAVRPLRCKVPVQARFRSDKRAAVLTLHRTQRKDRRVYTAFTGILAAQRPHSKTEGQKGRTARTGQGILTGREAELYCLKRIILLH